MAARADLLFVGCGLVEQGFACRKIAKYFVIDDAAQYIRG
jgi:hypothetical protein